MKYEIDVFHYLKIYKKEYKRMLFLIVIAMLIAGVTAYLQPLKYKSTVIALSSKKDNQSLNLGGFGLGSISIASSSNETIFSMLKSRRMANDINKHFDFKDKKGFRWQLDAYVVTGGFAIEVISYTPQLAKDIANFAVENVDKINSELQISPNKPLIKVLDPAIKGAPIKKEIFKRIIASALIVFFVYTVFIFFKEYFLRRQK